MPDSFRDKVFRLVTKIPAGKVATYGQIAALSGNRRAARYVGQLMRCNPDPLKIPCHRVVSGTGELTGYSLSGGISRKKKMLIDEGVVFNKDRVDLRLCLWSKEMNSKLPDLTLIPGVGKNIEHDLKRLGIHFICDLKNNDPERLYNRLVQLSGHPIDRCVLYVFREAVYYASNVRHDPKKLKWWNWSDKK